MFKLHLALIWAAAMAGVFWNHPAYYAHIMVVTRWKISEPELIGYHCADCKTQLQELIPWEQPQRAAGITPIGSDFDGQELLPIKVYSTMPPDGCAINGGIKPWLAKLNDNANAWFANL